MQNVYAVLPVNAGPPVGVAVGETDGKLWIEAYRGLLDDIARELGHRVKGIGLDVSGSVTLVGIDPDS